MGVWKNLLILAEEGDQEAIRTIAEHFFERKDYGQALLWFERLGDTKRLEEVKEKINVL